MVRTKIICTIGPASSNETVLRKMMHAGMDIARLNFSHGTHAEHAARIALIRRLNKKYRRAIKILVDLEGFRIRIGTLQRGEGISVRKRQRVVLSAGAQGAGSGATNIPFDYNGPLRDIRPGLFVYIDDGTIALKIKRSTATYLECEVVVPGVIKEHKGINIPGAALSFLGLSTKDAADIAFGIAHRVDYIAQSFVRTAADMKAVEKKVRPYLPACKLIAKIENREGIENIGAILKRADGIMIARGDMGVSIPIYEVPLVQKSIIRACNKARKFVITATQMLESMTGNLRPTRAEATDVANAVLDGTDMVMLSGETAVGAHPVAVVSMMNSILKHTERYSAHVAHRYNSKKTCRHGVHSPGA